MSELINTKSDTKSKIVYTDTWESYHVNRFTRVALLSDSEIKKKAVDRVLRRKEYNAEYIVDFYKINDPENQVEQPIDDGGLMAAKNRLSIAMNDKDIMKEHDIIIVMENYMLTKGEDRICVILYVVKTNEMLIGDTFCAQAKDLKLFNYMLKEYYTHKWGCVKTYGELLNERDSTISKNDWMFKVTGKPRVAALEEAFEEVYQKYQDKYKDNK